jgi:hypothetical protein
MESRMEPDTAVHFPKNPALYTAHPNLADEVNRNIIQSEIEGGVYLRDLPLGAVLAIETRNRFYTLVNLGGPHLRPSRLLSGPGGSAHPGLQLGRLDAQGEVRRPRHAPGV